MEYGIDALNYVKDLVDAVDPWWMAKAWSLIMGAYAADIVWSKVRVARVEEKFLERYRKIRDIDDIEERFSAEEDAYWQRWEDLDNIRSLRAMITTYDKKTKRMRDTTYHLNTLERLRLALEQGADKEKVEALYHQLLDPPETYEPDEWADTDAVSEDDYVEFEVVEKQD